MSTNQFRGKEETDKKDFGKKSIVEQQELSKESIPKNDNDVKRENEKLGEETARKNDEERSKHLH